VNLSGKLIGKHIKGLRLVRGLTQEVLAERSGLSPDTIRRLEHGSFSPSLETLNKLCTGLEIELSTFFEAAELGERDERRELVDLLFTRTGRELELATRVLRVLFDELDAIASERKCKEEEQRRERDEGDGTQGGEDGGEDD
jgi:transcriptional regulator with XRE-family HTH domain